MAYRKRMKKTRQRSALQFTMSPKDYPDKPRQECPAGMKPNPNWKEDGVMCIIDSGSITAPSSKHGHKGMVLTQPTKHSKRSRAHRGRRRRFGYMHLTAAGCKDDFDCPNPLDVCQDGVCVQVSSAKRPKRRKRKKISRGRARSLARGRRRRRR